MPPRNQISWVDLNENPEQIREKVQAVPHNLFTVCRSNLDKIIIIVRAKVLLDEQLDLIRIDNKVFYISVVGLILESHIVESMLGLSLSIKGCC